MTVPPGFVVARARAQPMSPEERRAAIIDAVIPLLREHGREVSTKRIAEAAGVAEGTIFRAFGDKESLISAALERYFDPEPFRSALREIDPDEPTEHKLRLVLRLLRERFTGVVGFMSALRMGGGPPPGARRDRTGDEWLSILRQVFRDDELTIPIDTLGFFLRIVAFGTAIPPLNQPHAFTDEELMQVITRGVLPPGSGGE